MLILALCVRYRKNKKKTNKSAQIEHLEKHVWEKNPDRGRDSPIRSHHIPLMFMPPFSGNHGSSVIYLSRLFKNESPKQMTIQQIHRMVKTVSVIGNNYYRLYLY